MAVLISCAVGSAAAHGDGDSSPTSMQEQVARAARVVAELRGTADAPLPELRVLDADELHADLRSRGRSAGEAASTDWAVAMELLGAIPPGTRAGEQVGALAAHSVHAYYDLAAHALVVQKGPRGASQAIDGYELAHEVRHAHQDQAYAWVAESLGWSRDDRILATRAVLEGDALATEFALRYGAEAPRRLAAVNESRRQALSVDRDPRRAPFLVARWYSSYLEGSELVCRLVRSDGGFDWSALDELLSDPPVSMEQVMHLEKYRAREHPIGIRLAGEEAPTGCDLRPRSSNTLGEFGVRSLFRLWGVPAADPAAEGWGGDSWFLLDSSGKPAVLWVSAWDTAEDATEFSLAARRLFQRRWRVDAGTSATLTSRDGQGCRVDVREKAVVLVVAANQAVPSLLRCAWESIVLEPR